MKGCVGCNGKFHNLEVTIVDSEHKFLPLMGRDWLDVLYAKWRDNFVLDNGINNISDVQQYRKDIFFAICKSFFG